ncbi:hypothetical protein IKG54_01835 [Candidatus Saccharibacteria bacterium]|nr:hypothetical protein [Candidatus Saccharibacteria bacterium]
MKNFFVCRLAELDFDADGFSEENLHRMLANVQAPIQDWHRVHDALKRDLSKMEIHTERELKYTALLEHIAMLFILNMPVIAIIMTIVAATISNTLTVMESLQNSSTQRAIGGCIIWIIFTYVMQVKVIGSRSVADMRKENQKIETYQMAQKILADYLSYHQETPSA